MSPKLLNKVIILSILGIMIIGGVNYAKKIKRDTVRKIQNAQKEQLQKQIIAQKAQQNKGLVEGTKQSIGLVECESTYIGNTTPTSISYEISTEKNFPENSPLFGMLQNFKIPGMESLEASTTETTTKKPSIIKASHTFIKIPSDQNHIKYEALISPTLGASQGKAPANTSPTVSPDLSVENLIYACSQDAIESQILGLSYKILPSSDIIEGLQWTSKQALPIDIPLLSSALQFNSNATITKIRSEKIFGVDTEVSDVSVTFSSPSMKLSTFGITNEDFLTYSFAKGIGLIKADIKVEMGAETVYHKKIALTGLKR